MKLNKALMTAFAAGASLATPAMAQDLSIVGAPQPGAMGFQEAGSSLAEATFGLHDLVLVIITFITLFVTGLLLYVIMRYNRKANPTPARFTHNSPLEIAWTIVPILILIVIGTFSLPVLFAQQEIPEGEVHIKVTGYQWYWGYEYTDEAIAFDSYMIGADEGNVLNDTVSQQLAEAGYSDDEFTLATDTAVVVPVGKVVVMTVTGADVIHSWAVPAFGVKQDAVPGRLAQLWFKADKEGIYFGQCSELCGVAHAYMPITIKVVSQEEYDAWLAGAKEEFAA